MFLTPALIIYSMLSVKFILQVSAEMKMKSYYKYNDGAFITAFNHALPGNTLSVALVPGMVSCNQKCLAHSKCVSYNYQLNSNDMSPGLCELKNKRVADENSKLLEHRPGYVFVQTAVERHVSTAINETLYHFCNFQ